MFDTLPTDARTVMGWEWERFQPFYDDLAARGLDAGTVDAWLADWSTLARLLREAGSRLSLEHDLDTRDAEVEKRYFHYIETIAPAADRAEQALREKLLASGLEPEGMAVPLRGMRAQADLFREANLPLLVEEQKLCSRYDAIQGAQTVTWEGEEIPARRLRTVFEEPDRARREAAWRAMHGRMLDDRAALDATWVELFDLRRRIAANADHPDYRAYVWQAYRRFDYTPADCRRFQEAIEAACVPAAARLHERHRIRLGLDRLRPWDLTDGSFGRPANPPGQPPLAPYADTSEMVAKSAAIFRRLDPDLGAHFDAMVAEDLMDLDNRTGKAPGGYCTYFATARRPFIYMNAVGVHDDVQTLLHEAGHAFHAFESSSLPFVHQLRAPMEFCEVASMAMELLAAPYFTSGDEPLYAEAEAVQARAQHLESMLFFWPYMAVVDAFQHWAYEHPAEAIDPRRCDAEWAALTRRFIPAVDWTGLDEELATGWHRKLHIFTVPFYYVEYGLAALGAAQVWQRALADERAALDGYRRALALGGTATLPELFAAAGARFAFDEETVGGVVADIEAAIEALEGQAAGQPA